MITKDVLLALRDLEGSTKRGVLPAALVILELRKINGNIARLVTRNDASLNDKGEFQPDEKDRA